MMNNSYTSKQPSQSIFPAASKTMKQQQKGQKGIFFSNHIISLISPPSFPPLQYPWFGLHWNQLQYHFRKPLNCSNFFLSPHNGKLLFVLQFPAQILSLIELNPAPYMLPLLGSVLASSLNFWFRLITFESSAFNICGIVMTCNFYLKKEEETENICIQQSGALLADYPGWLPAPTWWPTIASNSSTNGWGALFWPPWAPVTRAVHLHTHRQNTHT